MALTPLQQTYDRQLPSFQAKLGTITNIFQGIKASQLAKRQTAEQLAQQKELIEFRADVQAEKQKEVYESTTKPQKEAKQRNAMVKSYQDAIQKSSELRKKQIFENPASEYKLLNNIDFQPAEMPDGTYSPQPFMATEDGGLQQLSQTEFDYMQDQAKEVALVLQDIESRAEELDEVDSWYDAEGNLQVGSNNYKELIRDVQREGFDGSTAKALLAADTNRSLSVKTSPESETEKTWLNSSAFEFSRLAKGVGADQSPIVNITGDEGVPIDTSWVPFMGDKTISLNLNMALPYTENAKRIESFASNFEVDLSQIPTGNEEQSRRLRTAILSGDIQTLEDSGVPSNYVDVAESMGKMREAIGEQRFNFVTQYYTQVPTMWQEAVDEGYLDKDLDRVVPNFNYDGQINNLFAPIEQANEDVTYSIERGYSYLN